MTPNDCYMNHLHRLQLSIKSVAPKTLIFSHVSLMQGRADSLGFFLQGISISIFRLFVWSGGGGDLWGSTWITGIIENIQVPAEILKESQVERKKIAIKSGERKRKRERERGKWWRHKRLWRPIAFCSNWRRRYLPETPLPSLRTFLTSQ